MGKVFKAVTKPFEKVVKGAASLVGLRQEMPDISIAQDPNQIKAQNLAANLGVDLSNANTPTIETGGQVSSASDTTARKRATTGVSSNLGIGV